MLSGGDHVTLRSTPLENTSIKTGGRKRDLTQSKMARRTLHKQRKLKRDHSDKKRKTSLFKRISSKRASVEMQQVYKSVFFVFAFQFLLIRTLASGFCQITPVYFKRYLQL